MKDAIWIAHPHWVREENERIAGTGWRWERLPDDHPAASEAWARAEQRAREEGWSRIPDHLWLEAFVEVREDLDD